MIRRSRSASTITAPPAPGGYGCYKSCPLVSENLTEISDLVTQYVLQHREITVDKPKWLQFCSVEHRAA